MKLLACHLFFAGFGLLLSQEIPYTVASQPWPEQLGNHRARVWVGQRAEAVQVHIPWRRHDANPERKAVLVMNSSGTPIPNMVASNVTAEAGEIIFEAAEPGDYFVYYMPLRGKSPERKGTYLEPQPTADRGWLKRSGLNRGQLPQARVVEFQSRTKFDSFYPMEIVATREEVTALRAKYPQPYLLFAENREYPIRMQDALPLRWIASGPKDALRGAVHRGEFFVFQVGVYAQPDLASAKTSFDVRFEDLRGPGASIPAIAFECYNTGGIDTKGQPFRREFAVASGRVGALWCGVQVPLEASPARYEGKLFLHPQNGPELPVTLDLEVSRTFLRAGGLDQPERLARLKWLNSTAGLEERITTPYTSLEVKDATVSCLGRTVTFGSEGFPRSVRAGGLELLAAPAGIRLYKAGTPVAWNGSSRVVSKSPAKVVLESESAATGFGLRVRTTMEFDGGIGFDVRLASLSDAEVSDIALEIPFRTAAVPYIAGMGLNGGKRLREWQWKWTDQPQRWKDQGSNLEYFTWLGGVKAGLYCRLKSPLDDWKNGTAGGVTLSESAGQVLFRAQTGPRRLRKGDELNLSFRLLPTPVKPLEPGRFKTRYSHAYRPPADVRADSATVVNIHHDTLPNVWINYPFLNLDLLVPYVREAHAAGLKVKIYYTIRELTTRLPELWAFRSLGNEIYSIVGTQAHGAANLDSWLQEHLVTDYTPAWITRTPVGEVDAALRTHRDSRLNNFYLAGLQWLLENAEIDGIYLDEIGYPRDMMQRVRKVLETRPGAMIDLHGNRDWWSCNSPVGYYMEHLPYVDRVWFGEAFNPDSPPDFWLVEMSGIPFGLPGDLLQDPNLWRGMLFGMTNRASYMGLSPVGIWKLWDEFGIDQAEMIGWWDEACPVKTGNPDVLATVYKRAGKSLVSVASWAPGPVSVKLKVDWTALGLNPKTARFTARAIPGFQDQAGFGIGESIPVAPKRGWLFMVE